MAEQPKVSWYDETNTMQRTQWDAGIVEAGGYSETDTFLVWNNRNMNPDPASNPNPAVADMINVSLTTKSLAGDNTGPVASKTEATVEAMFFDSSAAEGAGEWGSIDSETAMWQKDHWEAVGGADVTPVIAAGGAVQVISGASNSASAVTDKANYAKLKLRLKADSLATAGEIEWLTRISYQY